MLKTTSYVNSAPPTDTVSARDISNTIFSRDLPRKENGGKRKTSLFTAMGQFASHEIGILKKGSTESGTLDIPVIQPDIYFPTATSLPMSRSFRDTFQSQVNQVTSYIDGSIIYGVGNGDPNDIRTFNGGKMILY